MVTTGAGDRVPERVAQLVYLDAEVPADGQSEYDLLPPDEGAGYQASAEAKGSGWLIPPPLPDPLPDDLDPTLRWAMERMVPPTGRDLPAAAAPQGPAGARGVPRLCAVH
jgi:hypothetical protein